jgi:hypothetical protein
MSINRYVCLSASFLLVQPSPASATGGFSCAVEDEALSFSAESALGRGMGSPIINLSASLGVKLKQASTDFAKLDLNDALVHSWMAGPDLNLHFYKEREASKPHGFVELIIKTSKSEDDLTSAGTYTLSVYDMPAEGGDARTLEATGKIACSVE